jgi:phosphate-selective porin OprO/OprP
MPRSLRAVRFAVLATVLPFSIVRAQSDSAALAAQIHALEQRVEQLEHQRDRGDSTARPQSAQPAGPRGFYVRNSDGSFQIRLRGQLQTDARLVANAPLSATTFLLRTARPIFEMTAYRILDARFVPDFGQGTAVIQDATIDVRARPWFVVRSGKFKPPIGLERLQSEADIVFVERGVTADLSPSRDMGLQLAGDVRGGILAYAFAVLNGALDAGTADLDNGSQKDVDARLFALPFKSSASALKGLGLGVGFSTGAQYGATGTPALPTFKTPAQVTVLSYRNDATAAGTTIADGTRRRLAPQAYWYSGPVGLMAEYVTESQDVRRGTTAATLTHRSWQAIGNVVLTGEDATFRSVAPAHPVGAGGHGALELGARVGALTFDDATFPTFADTATQVRSLRNVGAVVTWYLAPGIKLSTELDDTRFTGGAATGNRKDERAALIRLQHSF